MIGKGKIRATRAQWMITFGTFAASILLVMTALFGLSGVKMSNSTDFVYGIIASVLCGLGAVLCTIYSKRLSNAGWTSSSILAHRFYAIIAISFLMTYKILPTYLVGNIDWISTSDHFWCSASDVFVCKKGFNIVSRFLS